MALKANGDAIRAIRERTGISQTRCAKRAGVTASALSKVERGANGMSVENLHRLAAVLGVPLDAITSAVPEPAGVAS